MRLISQVLVTSQIENTILALEKLRQNESFIEIISPQMAEKIALNEADRDYGVHRIVTEKESFTLDDAKLMVEKAYMASAQTTIIILAAKIFTPVVQNKLLKVIEEPPANKVFILLTESKSTILSTIRSRLPMVTLHEDHLETASSGLLMGQLSLAMVYDFVQEHKRTDAKAMKKIVEQLSKEAIVSGGFDLDEKTLTLFSNAFIALDMGSPPAFVLNTLLLKLLARKKR
jgi:DNA polymerase-3 subunit delta'